ncbi:unnamed protein product [Oppiella nova]|uniref:Uncharacterized protein n=1 Tax=Oppiella nova TaxID=334625 RepID=A0A7R9LV94_9ACAR|nr:unnamed protein product [Oppiella nova]CAG2167340.1 unnamed protein product [Oppiella nova]
MTSVSNLLNALLLLTFINYISSQIDSNESPKTRNDVIQGIDNRRESIKYVMNVLNRLDRSLENIEDAMEIKRDYSNIQYKSDSKRCLSGLPGGDCTSDLGDWAYIPNRNPGKRSVRGPQSEGLRLKRKKCITGIPGGDCDVDVGPPVTEVHRNPGKRSVKCVMFGVGCDNDYRFGSY